MPSFRSFIHAARRYGTVIVMAQDKPNSTGRWNCPFVAATVNRGERNARCPIKSKA
jgi:hypothetical protein